MGLAGMRNEGVQHVPGISSMGFPERNLPRPHIGAISLSKHNKWGQGKSDLITGMTSYPWTDPVSGVSCIGEARRAAGIHSFSHYISAKREGWEIMQAAAAALLLSYP